MQVVKNTFCWFFDYSGYLATNAHDFDNKILEAVLMLVQPKNLKVARYILYHFWFYLKKTAAHANLRIGVISV